MKKNPEAKRTLIGDCQLLCIRNANPAHAALPLMHDKRLHTAEHTRASGADVLVCCAVKVLIELAFVSVCLMLLVLLTWLSSEHRRPDNSKISKAERFTNVRVVEQNIDVGFNMWDDPLTIFVVMQKLDIR